MKNGSFMICTFVGDTSSPPDTFVAEITSVDAANEFFTCHLVDTGQRFTFQYSSTSSGPWRGTDEETGQDFEIDRHDLFRAGFSDPSPNGLALVKFSDGSRSMCLVENISPTIDVVFYHKPYPRMSLELDHIIQSDCAAHPAGSLITSIEEYVPDDVAAPAGDVARFEQGWWSLAVRRDAHPGRIGGAIAPFATVIHTTDMVPGSWDGLLHRWTTEQGDGTCAHFAIGRDEDRGLVQLAPINRNSNHAGGPGHGVFRSGAQSWHPNSVSVGIEIHSAGLVRLINGNWRLVEDGVPQGPAIPTADVVRDPNHADRGWHTVTDYQYTQLSSLLAALEQTLNPLPQGCVPESIEPPPQWGVFTTGRVVGHVSLTASRRGDPWPPTCEWIRTR